MTGCGRIAGSLLCVSSVVWTACAESDSTVPAERGETGGAGPVPAAAIEPRIVQAPLPIDTVTALGLSAAFRAAASRALPAVVRITVTSRLDAGGPLPPGHPGGAEGRRARGAGSGFVIDTEGHILTNHHVIRNAELATVVLADGREYDATVVASDPDTDVGVIRVDPDHLDSLVPAVIGDSDSLKVGDWVLALGNPLDLNFTVTAGIISAKGRNLRILEGETSLEAFLQTDAAINPGNSGGPLVDLYGRVVGINAAIESSTGFFSGAGFAIPINLANKVAGDLIDHGVVHRPRLGVVIQDVVAADAEVYGLAEVTGAEIASVTPGLPAEKAGLHMGDVVLALDGERIGGVSELQDRIARLQPGARVRLDIVRYGQSLQAEVELAEFEPARSRPPVPARRRSGMAMLGFGVGRLSATDAERLGLEAESPILISQVELFGPAAEAYIRPGLVLLSINGNEIRSVRDVERIADGLEPGTAISVVVLDPSQADAAPIIYNYRLR